MKYPGTAAVRGLALVAALAAMLAFGAAGIASAQGPTPARKGASAAGGEAPDPAVLAGAWMRPDGGYVILIKSVGVSGELQAMYFNPNPLPFARAQAVRDGSTWRLRFELQAGGYNGSTYDLRYEAAADRLVGVYYQAVAKQSFDVQFVRK